MRIQALMGAGTMPADKPWRLTSTRDRLKQSTRAVGLVTDNERRRALRQNGKPARLSSKHITDWKRQLLDQGRREKAARKAAAKA